MKTAIMRCDNKAYTIVKKIDLVKIFLTIFLLAVFLCSTCTVRMAQGAPGPVPNSNSTPGPAPGPVPNAGNSSGGSSGGAQFKNPIGYNTVNDFLAGALGAIQTIVAGLAVLMIVVGGIMYITSAGGARAEAGKKAVTAALIGLALALAAPSLLKEIYGIVGGTGTPSEVSGARPLSDIVVSAINVLLSIVGVLSVLMLIVGGIMYITAAGSNRAETGQKIVLTSIVGLVISLLALVLVKAVAGLF